VGSALRCASCGATIRTALSQARVTRAEKRAPSDYARRVAAARRALNNPRASATVGTIRSRTNPLPRLSLTAYVARSGAPLLWKSSDDPTAAILILALLSLVPLALATLRTNPRLAIACALPATSFGIHMAQDRGGPGVLGVLFLSAAPLILTIAFIRTRHLQAQTRI
jgi:hypothetical protein